MASFVANIPSYETVLVGRLQSKDDGAFQEVLKHFGQRIFHTALKILKEEESAKDATQETLVNIHRAVNKFRGEAKLSTWINRITINVCLEMIRKNKKHRNRVEEDISERVGLIDETSCSPYDEARRTEVRNRVRAALGRLGEKHRIVVDMHDLQGFTIREIADQLEVAEGTIKSRLFYGREELKRHLVS